METKSLMMTETLQGRKPYYITPQCWVIETEYEGFICTTVTPNAASSTEPGEDTGWDQEYVDLSEELEV